MNKKILIGSIITVVILILVSFTGVVGYQTGKSSTTARASPLFNIRTSRAIEEESKDIACDYVGKGEETNIQLKGRIRRAELVQKAITIIRGMNDKTFSKFIARIILHLKNREKMADKETSDALKVLNNIRINPNFNKYYNTKYNLNTIINCVPTLEYFTCFGSPGCIINSILNILMWTLIAIAGTISSLFSCNPIPTAECC